MKDCRHVDMDALGGCGSFTRFGADRVIFDGLCYDNSNAQFGFTDALYVWKNFALNTDKTENHTWSMATVSDSATVEYGKFATFKENT